MLTFKEHTERLNKHRFRLLAAALVINFILPPLDEFAFAELIKGMIVKLLIILSGAEFFRERSKKLLWYGVGLINIVLGLLSTFTTDFNTPILLVEYISLVVMVVVLFYKLMVEITAMKRVNIDGIIGAFSGYILLGMIAFFTYLTIGVFDDNAFANLGKGVEAVDRLFYYSFISITTIGFGDIVPLSRYSQQLTIFFGIIGQFYLAVNVAILVSKYLKGSE